MNTAEEAANRRKQLRVPIIVIRVKGENTENPVGNTFFGYANNISRAGLFIQTINPKDEKEQFRIEFTLPHFDEQISCTAEVVWKRLYLPDADYEPGMGLKFLDLPEESAELIDRWVSMSQEGKS